MLAPIVVRRDPNLSARIVSEKSLLYQESRAGGPKEVRSGSGMAFAGERMVVIQDGGDSIAIIEGEGSSIVGIPLKGGTSHASPGKLQLEAMLAARDWKSE